MYEFIGQLIIVLVLVLAIVIALKFDKSISIFKNIFSKKDEFKDNEFQKTEFNQKTQSSKTRDNSTKVSKYFSEAFITIIQKNGNEKKYLINDGINIGRSEENDIILTPIEVSRHAFCVGHDEQGYYITVKDQRGFMSSSKVVIKRGNSVSLSNGDTYYFAEFKLIFSSYLCDIEGFNDESDIEQELDFKRVIRRN